MLISPWLAKSPDKICAKKLKSKDHIKAKVSALSTALLLMACLLPPFALAQNSLAQSILPPRPEAIGGGNPFEGLGRPDDPNPSRIDEVNGVPKDTVVTGSEGPPPGPEGESAEDLLKANQPKVKEPKAEPKKSLIKPALDSPQPGGLASMPEPAAKLAINELRSGRYEEALKHLKILSHIHPQAPEVDYLMGVACVMLLRFDHAKAHYLKVIQSNAPDELKELARKGLTKLGHTGIVE
ncbi:MAG: hypothetical protein QG625_40 [Cyanobacteriota bacterium erpe_2018_sw_39hr_WHONDRS-SW48-000098_B_bin.30]|jgi:hypothetical protein|nr:hypothetical protein [Cyanobacteriota bacterium erpe_2018_sw_39hr_WHONDRS-SW48-000098_B_bin.30]